MQQLSIEQEFYTSFCKGHKARIYQFLNTQQVNLWSIKVQLPKAKHFSFHSLLYSQIKDRKYVILLTTCTLSSWVTFDWQCQIPRLLPGLGQEVLLEKILWKKRGRNNLLCCSRKEEADDSLGFLSVWEHPVALKHLLEKSVLLCRLESHESQQTATCQSTQLSGPVSAGIPPILRKNFELY